MNVKSLIQEELGEGMTEKELASSIGVSLQTLENILADKFPEDPASWETLRGISGWMWICFGPVGRHTQ